MLLNRGVNLGRDEGPPREDQDRDGTGREGSRVCGWDYQGRDTGLGVSQYHAVESVLVVSRSVGVSRPSRVWTVQLTTVGVPPVGGWSTTGSVPTTESEVGGTGGVTCPDAPPPLSCTRGLSTIRLDRRSHQK